MSLNGRTSVTSIVSERLLVRKSSVTITRYRDLYWSRLDAILVLGTVCSNPGMPYINRSHVQLAKRLVIRFHYLFVHLVTAS